MNNRNPIVYVLRVYDAMGAMQSEQRFTESAKAAAEWMLYAARGKNASLSTEREL